MPASGSGEDVVPILAPITGRIRPAGSKDSTYRSTQFPGATSDYEIAVLGVAPTAIANDPDGFKKVISVTTAVANLLATCPGINVIQHEARSAANTSLDDVRYFKRLDLDYISERDGGEEPVEPA